MNKNFLISTGGSGGHVMPAQILAEHLSEEANIIFSTDQRGLRYLKKNMNQLYIINTPKLDNIFAVSSMLSPPFDKCNSSDLSVKVLPPSCLIAK